MVLVGMSLHPRQERSCAFALRGCRLRAQRSRSLTRWQWPPQATGTDWIDCHQQIIDGSHNREPTPPPQVLPAEWIFYGHLLDKDSVSPPSRPALSLLINPGHQVRGQTVTGPTMTGTTHQTRNTQTSQQYSSNGMVSQRCMGSW